MPHWRVGLVRIMEFSSAGLRRATNYEKGRLPNSRPVEKLQRLVLSEVEGLFVLTVRVELGGAVR